MYQLTDNRAQPTLTPKSEADLAQRSFPHSHHLSATPASCPPFFRRNSSVIIVVVVVVVVVVIVVVLAVLERRCCCCFVVVVIDVVGCIVLLCCVCWLGTERLKAGKQRQQQQHSELEIRLFGRPRNHLTLVILNCYYTVSTHTRSPKHILMSIVDTLRSAEQ